MADLRVSIEGDAELKRVLESTGHRLTEAITNAVAEVAIDVEREAKRNTPVDTGRLRSSLGVEVVDALGLQRDVATNVEYAPFVEFGTSTQPAQPFLTPAREKAAGRIPEIVAKHVRRVTGS